MEKIIILGGGIAGLTCLNALLDRGINALLLEGGQIGSPKMCGEFIAPYAKEALEKWEIGPTQKIDAVDFYAKQKKITIKLPAAALAFARSEAEQQLAARAKKLGGNIREQTFIHHIQPKQSRQPYIISLNNGEKLTASTVFFATGKFSHLTAQPLKLPYVGIKFHLPRVIQPNCLSMFSFAGAYLGLVPINNSQSNCAGLMINSKIPPEGAQTYFLQLVEQQPVLKNMLGNIIWSDVQYLEAPAPHFTLRNNPHWDNAYWIGDAVAGLYPAIGSGFAHSVQSALMAVDYFCKHQPDNYRHTILQKIKPKIRIGKILHHLLLQPQLCQTLMPYLQRMPWLINYLLKKMEYTG